jgi:hypothetical protein
MALVAGRNTSECLAGPRLLEAERADEFTGDAFGDRREFQLPTAMHDLAVIAGQPPLRVTLVISLRRTVS